jgi:hypothetical protein
MVAAIHMEHEILPFANLSLVQRLRGFPVIPGLSTSTLRAVCDAVLERQPAVLDGSIPDYPRARSAGSHSRCLSFSYDPGTVNIHQS